MVRHVGCMCAACEHRAAGMCLPAMQRMPIWWCRCCSHGGHGWNEVRGSCRRGRDRQPCQSYNDHGSDLRIPTVACMNACNHAFIVDSTPVSSTLRWRCITVRARLPETGPFHAWLHAWRVSEHDAPWRAYQLTFLVSMCVGHIMQPCTLCTYTACISVMQKPSGRPSEDVLAEEPAGAHPWPGCSLPCGNALLVHECCRTRGL